MFTSERHLVAARIMSDVIECGGILGFEPAS